MNLIKKIEEHQKGLRAEVKDYNVRKKFYKNCPEIPEGVQAILYGSGRIVFEASGFEGLHKIRTYLKTIGSYTDAVGNQWSSGGKVYMTYNAVVGGEKLAIWITWKPEDFPIKEFGNSEKCELKEREVPQKYYSMVCGVSDE